MATFGKTDDGTGATGSAANRKKVSAAVPSSDGVITSITIRGRVDDQNTVIKGVIYADDAGVPGALLAVSDEITINSTTEQAWTGAFTGTNRVNVETGTTYWIGWHQQAPSAGNFVISRNGSNTAPAKTNSDTYADGPTDPFGAATDESGPVDVFVTYTETETRRFYLANDVSPLQNGWTTVGTDDVTGIASLLRLSEDPFGSATSHAASETDPDTPYWVSQRAWLSPPASAGGTIGGNFEVTVGWEESSGSADLFPWVLIVVLQGDLGTSRVTPVNVIISTFELPTDGTASRLFRAWAPAFDFLAGDRILVHLGWRADNTDTTSYTSTIHYGGTGSTDLAAGDTDFTRPGWVDIDITPGITFAEPAGGPSVAVLSGGFLGML